MDQPEINSIPPYNEDPLPALSEPPKGKRSLAIFRSKQALVITGALVVLAIIGVAVWQVTVNHHQNHTPTAVTRLKPTPTSTAPGNPVFVNLPTCKNQTYLTTAPTDMSSFTTIPPLGAINPGSGHVLPSDHFGFTLSTNSSGATIAATVVAPGDVLIVSISKQTITQNGKTNQDYSMTFSPCREMGFYYNHLSTLSAALQALIDAAAHAQCQQNHEPQLDDTTCYYGISYQAKAGEAIGTAGGPGTSITGFDLGGYDTRTKELAFINKTRPLASPYQYLHTICPLDYFSTTVKEALYARVKNTVKDARGRPSCGSDMQDVPNTIQGNWYLHPATTGPDNTGEQLAFVHNNEDPHIGEISYGGIVTSTAGELPFNPLSSGQINREPSQVKADGQIYCYHQDNFSVASGVSPQSSGHFNVQLVNSNSLKIEFAGGACPATPAFNSPITYIRE